MASISVLNRSPSPSLDGEPERFCRACQSSKLFTDWTQGDRICTNCGLVDEERVIDDRPEWRDYDNDEDCGKQSRARSSLVPVDESKYLGGLQPTKLSSYIYGNSALHSSEGHNRLRAADRNINSAIGKIHALAMMDEKVAQQLRKRKIYEIDEGILDAAPGHGHLEVDEVERSHLLNDELQASEKWSLSRAIRLYGSAHEATFESTEEMDHTENTLLLSEDIRKAAKDLYTAYSMLNSASRKLGLPVHVTREATATLCSYARRRNGLTVRGVASTLKKKGDKGAVSPTKEKAAREALRDYNTMKQIGALCAGILFYTTRSHGSTRLVNEICESIEPHELTGGTLDTKGDQFIKKKHVSRALSELKECLPGFVSNQISTVAESVPSEGPLEVLDTFMQRMRLPLVAQSATKLLYAKLTSDQSAALRIPLVCASLTYFICKVGHLMESLADQADPTAYQVSKKPKISIDDFDAVNEIAGKTIAAERQAYEMRRLWDAWREQTPWHRSLTDIEQAYGVSRSLIIDHFKKHIFPARNDLLALLQACSSGGKADAPVRPLQALRETPLAEILLSKITIVVPLMKCDDKR